MSQLRATILAQQDKIASKSRFGLFSQPPPLAIGDDGIFKQTKHLRGEDGKPITKPRNLLAGTNRSGQGKKGYFAIPDSIYQGDQFKQTFKVDLQYQNKMHTKANYHENDFKPASGNKTLSKSAYTHVQQKATEIKTRKRVDENGRVKTQPRNITANRMSTVQRQFMKNPQYIADPIERKKEQQRKQREIFKSKLPQTDWKFAKGGIGAFGKDKIVYGIDQQAKQLMQKKKKPHQIRLKTFAHQALFVPAIKNSHQTIGKYPVAFSAKSVQTLRPRVQSSKKQVQAWKPNTVSKSKPSPSISINKKNLQIGRYKI